MHCCIKNNMILLNKQIGSQISHLNFAIRPANFSAKRRGEFPNRWGGRGGLLEAALQFRGAYRRNLWVRPAQEPGRVQDGDGSSPRMSLLKTR